ncbi:MAG: DNA alkylation repair protein [Gallionellaceae bacterium]|nr:MAG: DNA alkylation repair protein [Gallionellaceae bacterium]
MTSLNTIQTRLRGMADPATAVNLQRFFKTAPEQYGAGDVFLGIKVPPLRALVKIFRGTPPRTIAALLESEFHEERFFALLLLMDFYQRGGTEEKQLAYDLYLAHTARINNWDLVDVSAPHIVGEFLADKPRQALYALVQSDSLWERRIAILSTFNFIRRKEFSDTLHLAEHLLGDTHDLIHKATGWMLREVGKRDLATEEEFLQRHYRNMPRNMLRYAIERFPEARRRQYLSGTIR